ncbi:hypothetical protein LTR56_014964 [Elasticomyces elasticus]|nr:hypothetical protein LTR22_025615 [Elasticomyces elasticus]KAK3635000.1 hypothetical protein LTR56_014964 [Elasticomyces elasticus]
MPLTSHSKLYCEIGDGTLVTLRFLRSQPFNLMGLPAELRLRILSYLVEANILDVYTRGRLGPPQGMKLPNIVYATKILRAQYLLVAIANTTFRVHNGPGNTHFQEWLTDTDLTDVSHHHKDGFDAVKALEFPYFSRFPHQALAPDVPNSDVKLMLRCKNLESVRMNWVGSTLFDQATQGGKSVAQLRTEYRLDGMLGLHTLKRLQLERYAPATFADEVLENLAEWFRSGLKLNCEGKGAVVEII